MELIYTDAEHRTIKATLVDGEVLGNHAGPIEMFVPTDPANVDYSDILEKGLTVSPYVAPTPP